MKTHHIHVIHFISKQHVIKCRTEPQIKLNPETIIPQMFVSNQYHQPALRVHPGYTRSKSVRPQCVDVYYYLCICSIPQYYVYCCEEESLIFLQRWTIICSTNNDSRALLNDMLYSIKEDDIDGLHYCYLH